MKKIYDILISMKTMIFLTFLFATSSAIATFIENDYGTETAWAVVYGTRWFEIIMLLLAINLVGNIFRYKLLRKEKFPVLLFHTGFLVILIGAATSRYMGYEGMMPIREGHIQNKITSSNSFIQVHGSKEDQEASFEKQLLMSKISSNDFSGSFLLDGKPATIRYKDYLPNAHQEIVDSPDGIAMINMVIAQDGSRPENSTLKEHQTIHTKSFDITLNLPPQNDKPQLQIYHKEGKFYFKAPVQGRWVKMQDQSTGIFEANTEYPFTKGKLYDFNSTKLVPKAIFEKAEKKLVAGKAKVAGKNMNTSSQSALTITLSYNGKTQDITLINYGRGTAGIPQDISLGGANFKVVWGARTYVLPFSLKLVDFQLQRYPGSNSPSSYASEVILIDKAQNIEMPYRIYMNHVLDHRHFRFFQSSYDTDEKGTILSVNNDPGKIPTYIGYFMLALGLILNILNPKSRFRKLGKLVTKEVAIKLSVVFLLLGLIPTQPLEAKNLDPLQIATSYDIQHAEKFGDTLLQTVDGRIQPIDTFANEVMLKIHGSSSAHGLTASQILLGMMTAPNAWQDIKLIKIKHAKIKKILGLSPDQKYASFNDFFDLKKNHGYKLAEASNASNLKRPIKRNEFDRSVIKADEKLNIVYMIFTGDLMKIVPKAHDSNHKWYSVKEAISTFDTKEAEIVRMLFVNYFKAIDEARNTQDWTQADKALSYIQTVQHKLGAEIIPSESKLKAEKFFKKYSITNKLIPIYFLAGIILLGIVFYKIIRPHAKVKTFAKTVEGIFIFAFIIHTVVLAARWYIGGHAPWSNAYEAMLYVAWAMALAGIVFSRLSIIVPALTSTIAGSTLATTFFNEMNPQITNLVPVLKSYWLNIHVAVITGSYGFLALSAILGLFTLILFILRSDDKAHIDKSIIEATRINEMTAIIGLAMLTVGNFLGGVWANESWGRYWSWDPKETWAWISILVYVIVLHVRFIPAFKKNYSYNFAVLSTIAYASIVMTFVGVNYYLSGMHSYAAGDPVPIPKYLYLIIVTILAIIAFAFPKRLLKKSEHASHL